MGAPAPDMNPADEASAESLLSSLRTIAAGERRQHATVYNYWLSIRRDRDFPPIHDLDPLEISDAGAFSLLLEMIGGGEDAEIRHIGKAIKAGIDVQKVGDAPNPSLLSKIATRLPVVAACRDAFAFEDEFETAEGNIARFEFVHECVAHQFADFFRAHREVRALGRRIERQVLPESLQRGLHAAQRR